MQNQNNYFENSGLEILQKALNKLGQGFEILPACKTQNGDEKEKVEEILLLAAEKMKNNYPYFHPLYAGQMLKPPHDIARLAYMLAMYINPNNHALDGGRESSGMEKEAVAQIAAMFGWQTHLGHLTGGGTMANIEALWVAGKVKPGKKIVASQMAHYSHQRMSEVLGLEFASVPTDKNGIMDIEALKKELDKGNVGTVVATIGTTAMGAVDPLSEILELKNKYGFRVHADAAYGGYFILASELQNQVKEKLGVIGQADSIVIDPHKHGMQPYGCGSVIFKDPSVGVYYKHHSPYTYFSSAELHLGEISLECSRPGAAAVALWCTQKLFPLIKGGEFSRRLDLCAKAAFNLYGKIKTDERFLTGPEPELDIVVWAVKAESVTKASELARAVFEKGAENNLHLALTELPVHLFDLDAAGIKKDGETITALRSVLMKPEHDEWIDEIWNLLDKTLKQVIG